MTYASGIDRAYPETFAIIAGDRTAIRYLPNFREFVIEDRHGHGLQRLDFCPWSGRKYPNSLRDAMFVILEAAGVDHFANVDVPDEFRSEQWWLDRGIGLT